jgi:hypothetical protein
MASISSTPATAGALTRRAAAGKRALDCATPNSSLAQDLVELAEALAGILLLIVGSACIFTLWLSPVGLLLAALGAALIAVPKSFDTRSL